MDQPYPAGRRTAAARTRRVDVLALSLIHILLVACMPAMAEALVPGGLLALSGFLEPDVPLVVGKAIERCV